MPPGHVRRVEVADLVDVRGDIGDDIALHHLHVVDVVKQLHGLALDLVDDLEALAAGIEEVAHVVDQRVEWFEHQRDPGGLGERRGLAQAGDDPGMLQLAVTVGALVAGGADDLLAVEQRGGREGFLRGLGEFLGEMEVEHALGRLDHEGGHGQLDLATGGGYGVEVFGGMPPEFHAVEAGVGRGGDALDEIGELGE